MRIIFMLCAAISVAVFILVRPVAVPPDSELRIAEGTIVESYRVSDSKPDVIFRLSDHPRKYRYDQWFPNYDNIEPRLYIGNSIRVAFTARSADSGWADVWRVEHDGVVLATREQIAEARQRNGRIGYYVAAGFGLVPVVLALISMYSRWKNRRAAIVPERVSQ